MVLAFYLDEFIKTGHAYSDNISDDTRQLISEITSTNFRPPSITRGHSSRSDSSSLNPRSQRSQSIEPPPFPQDWAIDRGALRAALANFEAGTQDFISLVGQPSGRPVVAGPSASSSSLGKRPATSSTSNTNPSNLDNPSGPPSTGNTPPTSGPVSSSSERNSTGATSAEEGIFRHPIGPEERNIASNRPDPVAGGESSNANDDDWRDSGFDQRQWAALRRLLGGRPPGGPEGPPTPPGPAPTEGNNNNSYTRPWNAKELGFFDDNYGSKTVYSGGAAIEHIDSRAIF